MRYKLKTLESLSKQVNSLTDRQAMGLPETYQDFLTLELHGEYQKLWGLSAAALIQMLEHEENNLDLRFAAGTMLNLIGDPRIQTLAPTMIEIPATKAKIGLPRNRVDTVFNEYRDTGCLRDWIIKETPQYTKKIEAFSIGKYPVTNYEYRQFLIENPTMDIPSSWRFGRFPYEHANHPVHTVSIESAMSYTRWLSQKTNRRFRLPTEFEWEYAASGPTGSDFPWGDIYAIDHANTIEEGIGFTTPVGIFPKGKSCFGVLDMAGNVEEYTCSVYEPYPGAPNIEDDLQKRTGFYHVARGGGYTRHRDLARTRRRHGHFPRELYAMGFRLVETK